MAHNYTPAVKKLLRQADHEIWYSPISGRRFMVDAKIKSRHWANHTLKQAGLPKAF
jgi:hypothetical protein